MSEKHISMLRSRLMNSETAEWSDVLRLFPTLNLVNAYNDRKIGRLGASGR